MISRKERLRYQNLYKSMMIFLENRPLTDDGIEPDPFHLTRMPSVTYSFGKYEERWAGRDHITEYEYR
ncbi:unnamed protein product [Trifolium pratense]|uniref:Uncharacterized protein n=1 Tax=Trifolium pratense TaxID=57577 RepID=A0ACB0LT66_TRIPR|nr:unnamed protein product [Trifolium pratense]